MKKIIATIAIGAALSLISLQGALSISTTAFTYSQDFDSLPTANTGSFTWTDDSTLLGWYRRANVNNTTQTLDPDLTDLSAQGSNVGPAAFYNASTANNSDRAAGFRVDGQSGGLKKGSLGMVLSNDTGLTLTGFDLGYKGEKWYQAVNETTLLVQYAVVDSFATDLNGDIDLAQGGTWNDLGSLSWTVAAGPGNTWTNGTSAGNFNEFTSISVSGLSIAPGQDLVIRWRIAESGVTRSGLFIDDVSFGNLTAVPEPSTFALLAGLATFALVMYRRRKAK